MRTLSRRTLVVLWTAYLSLFMEVQVAAAKDGSVAVSLSEDGGRIEIYVGNQGVATYVYDDPAIPRPYFCHVKSRRGVTVARPNPPDPAINKGNDDHPLFHPGMWLAFGDINGEDFWRNKARTRHVRFIETPSANEGYGGFSVENEYVGEQGDVVCREACTYTVWSDGADAWFLTSRSQFYSDAAEFAFGDQEEMGFGVRLNTPITVKFGSGHITDSDGGQDEEGTWGKAARWCGAWGEDAGRGVAVAVMPGPANFRSCWFHTRNYGLIVANPFGKKAMTGPDDPSVAPDATIVKKDEVFTLCFGVWIADSPRDATPPFDAAYKRWMKSLEQRP